MTKGIFRNAAAQQIYQKAAAAYENQDTPYFILNRAFEIIWQNKTAAENCPSLSATSLLDMSGMTVQALKEDMFLETGNEYTLVTDTQSVFFYLYLASPECQDELYIGWIKPWGFEMRSAQESCHALELLEQNRSALSHVFTTLNRFQRQLPVHITENAMLPDYFAELGKNSMQLWRLVEMMDEYMALNSVISHQIKRIDIKGFLTDVFTCACRLLNNANTLILYPVSNSPEIVWTEPEPILRILGHLISNAVRNCSNRRIINVSYEVHDSFIDIRVWGNSQIYKNSDRMFEPFFSDTSDERVFTGNGLGLPLAQGYAEFMGGNLSITKDGSGTIAKLSFPLHYGPGDDGNILDVPEHGIDIENQLRILLSDCVSFFHPFHFPHNGGLS